MTNASQPPRPYGGSGLRPIARLDLGEELPSGSDDGSDDWDEDVYAPGLQDRFRGWLGRMALRAAWLGLAACVALGSAGIVAAVAHSPSVGGRPELTWGADRDLSSRLDAAVRDLAKLNDDVEVIGTMARNARAAVSQVNQVDLSAAIVDGNSASASIDARAADLSRRLDCQPWTNAKVVGLSKTYSTSVINRYTELCQTIASVAPIHDDWAGLVLSGQTAMQVAADLNTHDQVATEALKLATAGKYADAIVHLNLASVSIDDATQIATLLAKVTDVSTLQTWLTRTSNMDDALRLLWRTVIASKGKVTPQVKAALKNVSDVKALLPDDNAVLGVVLYEMGLEMTADGISIETAKGQLSGTLGDLVGGSVFGR